jgi:sugar lactone lactonase YvrE
MHERTMIKRSADASGRGIGYATLAATLLLAGCAGAAAPYPAPMPPGEAAGDSGRPLPATYPTNQQLLFVSENVGTGHVGIYLAKSLKKNREPIAEITDAISTPYGLAQDSSGTLYVADNPESAITEYPKGQTTHSVTITDGLDSPLGLAIDKSGTLYVSNVGTIQEYAHGSTSPTKTVTGGGMTNPFGLALDKKQNLYIADFIAAKVFELPKGGSSVTSLNLQGLSEPIGVCFDASGNLWVTNANGGGITVYPPGQTSPSETITSGYTNPYAISAAGGIVVASNSALPNTTVYAYKSGDYTPYATLTKGVVSVTGLLLTK